MAGVKAQHIPYKGTGPALIDLMAGQYHYNFTGLTGGTTLMRAGKLRGIAVTMPKRVAAFPDIPAVAEALPGFEIVGWYGVIGPAKLPKPIVTRLHDVCVKVLKQRDIYQRILEVGAEPVGSTPEQFRKFLHAHAAKWAKIVNESGAKRN